LLPKPSADILKKMLSDRLSITFEKNWFRSETEQTEFVDGLKQLWNDALVVTCTNIRKTALLLNDISAAARLIEGEANPELTH
jgi:hypothetical protein